MPTLPPMLDSNIHRQFLCSLLSDSQDHTSPLVYADWLEETGDHALAEVIRVQLQFAQYVDDWQGHGNEIMALENELHVKLKKMRLANNSQRGSYRFLPQVFADWSWSIGRGIVTLSVHQLSENDPIPMPPEEWIRRFGWYVIRVGDARIGSGETKISVAGLQNLFASPLMDRCLGLQINHCALDPNLFNCILESPRLLGLVSLDLMSTCGHSSRRRADGLLKALVDSPNLQNLWRLELGYDNFGDDGLEALAKCGRFSKLRELGVFCVGAHGEGLTALFQSSHFPELEVLDIGGAIMDEKALTTLAHSVAFPRLKRLNLKVNHINGKLARILAGAANLQSVRDLNLDDNPLGDAGAEAIVRAPHFAGTNLCLDRTKVKAKTVKALAETGRFRSGTLKLWSCNLSDRDLKPLTSSPEASHLTSLLFGFSKITDEGARLLAESPYLKNVKRLILDYNKITDAGIDFLLAPTSFPALRIISLDENPISARGRAAITRWNRKIN